jgi:hypothetical protein
MLVLGADEDFLVAIGGKAQKLQLWSVTSLGVPSSTTVV